ncbi:sugar phosphate isomerase/epimerase family protein [Paenibacillaceae bacterium WGS1546]|uniref:sugar phosphate isomerase/epimerase family protein n=1 Tax=Cohnella sp. WGS1546 TaxID=3366810 RepID=UPI00372D3885
MNWLLTTVSFRYYLYSIKELLRLAEECGFEGIELWEPHYIRHRSEWERMLPAGAARKLPARVMSAYLDVTDFTLPEDEWLGRFGEKAEGCRRLGIPLVRLFTGNLAGLSATDRDWSGFYRRLEKMQKHAALHGIEVAFETHPGTLLDHPAGVERLISRIGRERWSCIGLNFDVFHVWEFGGSVPERLNDWYPYIKHVHLKNSRRRTGDFAMANVYHPLGRMADSDSISSGVVPIEPIVQSLRGRGYSGSLTLEWFGEVGRDFFHNEIEALNGMIYATEG